MNGKETCLCQIERNDWDAGEDVLNKRFATGASLWGVRAFYSDENFGGGHRRDRRWCMIREESLQIDTAAFEGNENGSVEDRAHGSRSARATFRLSPMACARWSSGSV